MRGMKHVSELLIYPVISARGAAINQMAVGAMGPLMDRCFGVLDANGFVLSQKDYPEMAHILASFAPDALVLTGKNSAAVHIPLRSHRLPVEVKTTRYGSMMAEDAGDAAAKFLYDLFGESRRLAVFPERMDAHAKNTGIFERRQPFHIITQESLKDLNARLEMPVPMDRFRPNIVISGAPAYSEDTWKKIRIGNVVLTAVKPTIRCSVTTVDQETSERGSEPMKTLQQYRILEKGVAFGHYYTHENSGSIHLGDEIEIIE